MGGGGGGAVLLIYLHQKKKAALNTSLTKGRPQKLETSVCVSDSSQFM